MQSTNRQKPLNAKQNTSPTLRRPYPTTVSHQQFRPQVGSHNTPYTAKHSIQTRHRDTLSKHRLKPLNTTQKQAAILYCKSTTPNRGRVTQHTIQPHIASKSANARPRHAVKEPPETWQHHAKHQAYSSATLPNYFFKSTTPNTGRVTQHTIQPHIASKSANARPRHAVKEPPETWQHHAKHQAYSSATLPIYCFHSPRTGVSCDPTPVVFCCACHAIVLPYMLQGQLRPYPPHRGRVTTDSEEVGSQPTPLPVVQGAPNKNHGCVLPTQEI